MEPVKRKTLFLTVIIILTLFVYSVVHAEQIEKINFKQLSPNKYPEEVLLFNTQLRAGHQFDESILNSDIKRLFSTGYFSDVVSETSKTPDGKIIVTFKLTAKPKIKKIIFEGNKKFDTEKLREQIAIYPESPLNDKLLQQCSNKLREFYKDKGYNDATVSPKVIKADQPGYVNIIFDIDEHLRLKVNSVKFVGNTVFWSWTLRQEIVTQHSYFSWLFDIGLLNRDEVDNDKIRLRELYWNKGYLDFKVEKVEIKEEEGDPEYVDVTFYLHEGKPYNVGNVYISGNHRYTENELQPLLELKSGEVYDNRIAKKDSKVLANKYYPLGYANFICTIKKIPNYETHVVDINYKIDEGRRFYIQDINISGNRVTKDYVIRRELSFSPGDPLDKNQIDVSKSRLMGLGYFKKVDAVTSSTDKVDMKDIDLQVEEKKTAEFKIGAGISDTDSLSGMLQLSQSNFDISDPGNYFRGGGQRLMLQTVIGIEKFETQLKFTEPWLAGIPLRLDLNGYVNTRYYERWREQRIGGSGYLSHKIFDEYTSITGGFRFEQVRVYHMKNSLSSIFQKEEGRDWVSTLSLSLNRDTRDSAINPTSGYEVNALAELTSKLLGASNNYYRLEGKGIYYFSFLEKALIFHLGGKFGLVDGFGGTDRAPIYERYFLGGGDTVRGFPYRSISPEDYDDKPYGGESMMLLTAEMTHPIWDFIRGAIFVDVGSSWEDAWSYKANQINVGVGYGLRIKLPYITQPIRLDLAYPLLNKQDGVKERIRFHFNMGFTW